MGSFYLCPTEKRNTFSSAEAPLERQKHKLLHKIRTKKNFNFFYKKSCQLKNSYYLCSPN